MSFSEEIDLSYSRTLDDETPTPRCSRGIGIKHLHCIENAVRKCAYCNDARGLCDDHDFGTKESPMCYECAQEELDQMEADEMQLAARMIERGPDLEIDYPEVA